MKGLLLKDWYLLRAYCWSLLLISVLFIGVSMVDQDTAFFLFYPLVLAAILPATLYSIDERENWNAYCAALPVSRAEYVSAKYLIGLFCAAGMLLLIFAAHGLRLLVFSAMDNANANKAAAGAVEYAVFSSMERVREDFASEVLGVLAGSMLGPTLILPLLFRFGAERGRIAYYAVFGLMCAVVIVLLRSRSLPAAIGGGALDGLAMLALSGLLYAASWLLSVSLYKKREL